MAHPVYKILTGTPFSAAMGKERLSLGAVGVHRLPQEVAA